MSENAEVELTHLMIGVSFTKPSWRCPTDPAEGGTSERDLLLMEWALRATNGALVPPPEIGGIVSHLEKHRLTQPQLRNLVFLETFPGQEELDADAKQEAPVAPPREPVPMPRQLALWKAVQHTKVQGVSLRGSTRELGIARNTVRRYTYATGPPANRPRTVPDD